jgi:hypothetical protein
MEEKTLNSLYNQLTEPFSIEEIEIKPGATTKDKAKALALPYADRTAYQDRLDRVVGPGGWSVEYRQISENSVFCRLTILGVVREDVGECHKTDREGQPDENRATTAVAQSFKRACNAFGIGRYLNSLPQIWAEYDGQKRQFVDVPRVVADIYRRAGIRTGGGGGGSQRGGYAEKSAPVSEPARQARPAPKPQPMPEEEPPAPRPSREESLSARIQKASDDASLRAVVDEIKQARKQNDIDDAAQDRLKILYKQQQDKFAKQNEPEPREQVNDQRSSLRNTKPQTQPAQPAPQPAKPTPSRPKF